MASLSSLILVDLLVACVCATASPGRVAVVEKSQEISTKTFTPALQGGLNEIGLRRLLQAAAMHKKWAGEGSATVRAGGDASCVLPELLGNAEGSAIGSAKGDASGTFPKYATVNCAEGRSETKFDKEHNVVVQLETFHIQVAVSCTDPRLFITINASCLLSRHLQQNPQIEFESLSSLPKPPSKTPFA